MSAISRDQLRLRAQEKIDDANLLFDHGRYSNAFYLYGYGVEFALKARIAKRFLQDAIPDRAVVRDVFVHDIEKLIRVADLIEELKAERQSYGFGINWATVTTWSEESRYESVGVVRATAMRHAVTDAQEGVFQWLTRFW